MTHVLRGRRLNLGRLEAHPPENLAMVHAILLGAVKDIQNKLRKLETSFYGAGGNPEAEIAKWTNSVNAVLRDVGMPYFNWAGQIDDVVEYITEPNQKMQKNIYDIKRLQECLKKVMDAVPERFTVVIRELWQVVGFMEKYCLSFYDLQSEVYLDTSHNYQKQRIDYLCEINLGIENISRLIDKFKTKGVALQDFSVMSQEMARRMKCASMPFLLIFPNACEDVRNTCTIMMTMLAADANYASFLSNDIMDLEQKKQEVSKSLREQQHTFHKLSFRLKQSEHEHAKLLVETAHLASREDELIVDEERLSGEANALQVDIEMKEFERDELMKKTTSMSTEVIYQRYSAISEELRMLKLNLPLLKRQLNAAKHKLAWIKDKKKELVEAEKELGNIQEDMIEVEVGKEDQEKELSHDSRALELAKQLHLYKTTSDTLRKLFHNQPLSTSRATSQRAAAGKNTKGDLFEKACHLVAANIESDWPRLYRLLPFFPLRGDNIIDRDISEMSKEQTRDGTEVTALRALGRWRRFHTRARLEDLQVALGRIRRPDMVRHLVAEMAPRPAASQEAGMSLEQEAKLYNIDPALLPYLKEVERYDELRAASRL